MRFRDNNQVVPFPPQLQLPDDEEAVASATGEETRAPHSLVAVVPDAQAAASGSGTGKSITWDRRTDVEWLSNSEAGAKKSWCRWLEVTIVVLLAGFSNALCYANFVMLRAREGDLYSVVDVHLALLPGIDVALCIWSAFGTVALVLLLLAVDCYGQPWFYEIMTLWHLASAVPSSVICGVLVWYMETTHWAPPLAFGLLLAAMACWCLHVRLRLAKRLGLVTKVALDVSWFVAGFIFFAVLGLIIADKTEVVTGSDSLGCDYFDNAQMPIQVRIVDEWYCAEWGSDTPSEIYRAPTDGSIQELYCNSTYLDTFGASLDAHTVTCPPGCLGTSPLEYDMFGCLIYTTDSSICMSAIHAGAVSEGGGSVTVYGRVGVPFFESCTKHSLQSEEKQVTGSSTSVTLQTPSSSESLASAFLLPGERRRLTTAPEVYGSDGNLIPQAFHFNMPETREYLWLKGYEEVSTNAEGVEEGKPWTRMRATVSVRVAGLELEDEKVTLGDPGDLPLFQPRDPGEVIVGQQAGECSMSSTGVVCRGVGAAVVQVSFCKPEEKTCA